MLRRAHLVFLAVGCSAHHGAPAPDAGPPPLPIYLAFDGFMLQPANGVVPDSATATAVGITVPTMAPPYLDGAPDRDARIAAIVAAATSRMAPFDVEIVTTQPTRPYFLVVVTGASNQIDPASPPGISAFAYQGCTDSPPLPAAPHGVAVLMQSSATSDAYNADFHANEVLGSIAIENYVPLTLAPNDCMCWFGTSCDLSKPCVIGGANTPVDAPHSCPGAPATIDELAALHAVLGTRS
jgi:hypothetical protein